MKTQEQQRILCVQTVCNQFGIDAGGRLAPNTRKRKFLVQSVPSDSVSERV
jgi:hypothetical protein